MIDYFEKLLEQELGSDGDARQPAGVQALQMILRKLCHGEFQSGQPIKESLLAKELDLSRNAVREALNQIVGWELFEYVPYCGYRVRKFSSQDVLEWYEIREALEPIAARRLARAKPRNIIAEMDYYLAEQIKAIAAHDQENVNVADMNFHLTMISNCGNRRFCHMQNMSYLAASFFFNSLSHQPALYELSESTVKFLPPGYTEEEFERKNEELTIATHRRMLDAIKNGDANTAEVLFREHAHNQVQNVENLIMYYGHLKLDEILCRQKVVLS